MVRGVGDGTDDADQPSGGGENGALQVQHVSPGSRRELGSLGRVVHDARRSAEDDRPGPRDRDRLPLPEQFAALIYDLRDRDQRSDREPRPERAGQSESEQRTRRKRQARAEPYPRDRPPGPARDPLLDSERAAQGDVRPESL